MRPLINTLAVCNNKVPQQASTKLAHRFLLLGYLYAS